MQIGASCNIGQLDKVRVDEIAPERGMGSRVFRIV